MLKLATKGYIKVQEVQEKVVRSLKNEDGQGTSEYGAVLVLVLAVAIPVVVAFRNQLINVVQTVTNSLGTR
jgi:Flp pilus assembly pilin Flp